MSKPSTNQTSTAFNSLCYGARFQYIGSDRTWVKVGSDLVAEWDASKISDSWIGQALCSFSEDGDTTTLVNLVPEFPALPTASSRLTREQQIVAMADSLRTCRWFKTPDGIPEDKHMIWATNMWEAANPLPGNMPTIRPLDWSESGETLKAGMLGQHYLINPSRMIDKFKLSTPDGTDYFPTIEAAQAAAQIDIERRVGAVYIRPKTDGAGQPSSYTAVHAHTIRKAASREDDNGNTHLAAELRAAMRFVEQIAG